ncbi:MarR family winged helix-turn-helix transcriptional regulator [Candidatus Margulisiibacteriota bacterium]
MADAKKLTERAERLVFIVPEVLKRLFQGHEHQKDTELPCSHAQMKVLHTLGYKGQCNMSELSNWLDLEMSTVTVMVDALVENGLAERHRDEKDRRVVLVSLTKKGQEVFKMITDQFKKNIARLFSKIPENKQAQIVSAFEQVYNIFTDEKL